MALLPTLILAHLIADFPLQTDAVFRFKNQSAYGIWFHVLIHVFVTACLVKSSLSTGIMVVIIGVLHFCCDWYKIHYTDEKRVSSFLGDQIAHVVILVVCASFFIDVDAAYGNLLLGPALAFALIPGFTVFLFVLGHDLASRGIRQPQLVAWSMIHGLNISHYFAPPLVALLGLAWLL